MLHIWSIKLSLNESLAKKKKKDQCLSTVCVPAEMPDDRCWSCVCCLHSWRTGTPCLWPLARQSSASHQRSGCPGLLSARLRFRPLGLRIKCVKPPSTNLTGLCRSLFSLTQTSVFKLLHVVIFFSGMHSLVSLQYVSHLHNHPCPQH